MYVFSILLTIALFCTFVIGLIEPNVIVFWGPNEDKTKKKVLKYFGIAFFLSLVLLVVTHNMAMEEKQRLEIATQQKAENDKKQKEIQANKKYADLLNSGKTYDDMTTDEKNLALDLFKNWDNKSDDFKEQYQSKKEALEKSKDDFMTKLKAEKEAADAKKAEEDRIGYDTGITYEQLARTPDNYKGKKAKFTGKVVQVIEGDKKTDLRIAVNEDYDKILYVSYNPNITSVRILEKDNVTVKGVSQGIYSYKSTLGSKISVPLLIADSIDINK